MSYPTFSDLFPKLQLAAKRWVPDVCTDAGMVPGFNLDDENRDAVRYVLAWAIAHPSFAGDAGKGLMLMGHRGTGKTLLMRSLGACLERNPLHFRTFNTRKIVSAYNVDGDEGLREYLAPRHMMFDDLGDERTGQHYGDKVEVMGLVIQERYELFVNDGVISHFTTNLLPDDIRTRYGDRVYSRLKHMVNSIRVGAEVNAIDRRDSAKAKPRPDPVEETEHIPASPEVAKEAFERIRAVVKDAKEQFDAKHMRVVSKGGTSQEADLSAYRDRIRGLSDEQLESERHKVMMKNTATAAGPFIEAIDSELSSRNPSKAS